MKAIKFFIISALALGAIACTQEPISNNDSGLVPAKVTAGMFTKADGAYWTGDRIGVFAVSPDEMAAEYQNVGYATESTSTTADFTAIAGEIYLIEEETYFTAYAPYQSGLDGNAISGSTLEQSDPIALDYLYASDATASSESPVVNFNFSHKMSQLIVNFVSTTEEAVNVVKAGAYTVAGLSHEGTFNVLTGETEVTGDAAEMTISGNCLSADVSGDYEGIAYQMLLFPQTADVYFAGTVNGEEFTTTAVSQTLKAGYSYNCTIELTIDEVTGDVTATVEGSTINDWEYGDWGDSDTGDSGVVDLNLVTTDGGSLYTYDGSVVTILGNCTITSSGDAFTGRIVIDPSVSAITLDNVNVDADLSSINETASVFDISSTLALTLVGDNYIKFKPYWNDNLPQECILAHGDITLTIEGEGSLTAEPDSDWGHNGAISLNEGANLVINSGTITANAYYYSAAIGSLIDGECGDIIINGGTINASTYRAVSLGASYSSVCGDIIINGGTFETKEPSIYTDNVSGIGCTEGSTCGNIIINSGASVTVVADARWHAVIGVHAESQTQVGTCGDIIISKDVTSVVTINTYYSTPDDTIDYIGVNSEGVVGTIYLGVDDVSNPTQKAWTPAADQFDVPSVTGWTLTDGTWYPEGGEPDTGDSDVVDLSELSTSGGAYYTYDGSTLTITDNCTLTNSGGAFTGQVVISSSVTELTLDNMRVDRDLSAGTTAGERAFDISSTMTLNLVGDNYIDMTPSSTGSLQQECLFVHGDITLTITGDGSLTVTPDSSVNHKAAIDLSNGANLVIESGTITVTSYYEYPGIGSAAGATCGNITINGGTVTAVGGNQACGIGAGSGSCVCGDIIFNGGTVKASVGSGYGTGIGTGNGGTCGRIIINEGASVSATSNGALPATIGVGGDSAASKGTCGDIIISKNVTSVVTACSNNPTYYIGTNGGDCGTVYLGVDDVDSPTIVDEWTPASNQFVVSSVTGWTLSGGTWYPAN